MDKGWHPQCPLPGHGAHKIWKSGWRGKPPRRRQRYRCVDPVTKAWHYVEPPVPRVEALTDACLDCESDLAPGQGPNAARRYDYVSREIAAALVALANGASYMEASANVRVNLARHYRAVDRDLPWTEDTIRHGQLAANWVETYTDVVLQGDEDVSWPDVVLVDSTSFWRYVGQGRRAEAFHLLCAYGYDAQEAGSDEWTAVDPETGEIARGRSYGGGRLLRVVAAQRSDTASWTEFFASWPGRPEVLVGDYAQEIRAAARAVWPSAMGLPAPEFVRCRWHLRQNLVEAVREDLVLRDISRSPRPVKVARAEGHPLLTGVPGAFSTSQDWHAFRALASQLFEFGPPYEDRLPRTLRWLRDNELVVLSQIARRPDRLGPESTGPLEAEIATLRGRLARRAQTLTNKARTDLLLRLMVAGRRGDANEQAWAEKVRQYLLAREGYVPEQRPYVNAGGVTTL